MGFSGRIDRKSSEKITKLNFMNSIKFEKDSRIY